MFGDNDESFVSLRFRHVPAVGSDRTFSQHLFSMMDASVPWDCNFISWNTAFCAYPCVVSRDSTSGLYTELEMISDMYLGRKLIPHHPSSTSMDRGIYADL